MPRARTGTLIYRADVKRWTGAVTLDGGRRRFIYGKTEDEARAKLAALGSFPPPVQKKAAPVNRTRIVAIVRSVLDRGRQLGWDDEMVGCVIAASLTSRRVAYGIVGPCVYCGDELADTVDHIEALSRGGAHEAANLASCCTPCNRRKGNRQA